MERLEEQIHLRNIVSCLTQLSDYTHYLSFERYLLDRELKKVILDNLKYAGKEASYLYERGCKVEELKYLVALKDISAVQKDNFAVYSLLQNDLDYLADRIEETCRSIQQDVYKVRTTTYA